MAWLAVGENGDETIFTDRPERKVFDESSIGGFWIVSDIDEQCVRLPYGTINKLIGKWMTWHDEPFLFLSDGYYND